MTKALIINHKLHHRDMIKFIKLNYIDCTANNYHSSKPCLPIVFSRYNRNKPRVVLSSQKNIWDLIKAHNFEQIETIKHNCYLTGNHKAIEDIEQWILQ